MDIPFDGVPFMIVSKKIMSCQYGSDKCIAQKRRYRQKMEEPGVTKKRRNVVFCKKRDCPVQIRFREVIKFPDYKVVNDSKYNRRVQSRKCHHDMKTGVNVRFERQIYVLLPSPDDHQFHPTHKKDFRMRAAVLDKSIDQPQYRLKVIINKVSRPEPKKNEVRIKVAATSVSRQDIAKRYESWPLPLGVSSMVGTDAAGTIEKVGDILQSKWKKGDRVMCLVSHGGNAEYAIALEDHVMPIPDFMSFSAAAAIPEAWITAYYLLHVLGGINKGDDVLIHAGASGVGTALIQLVKLAGGRAIVTASSWSKLEMCKNIGAVAGFNYKEQDFAQEVLTFTKDQGVTLILDCVGAIHCAGNAQVIATEGVWVVYGLLSGTETPIDLLSTILKKRVNVIGASMQSMDNSYKAELVAGFKERLLPHFSPGTQSSLSPIINKLYPLKCVGEAYHFVESNSSMGKVILTLEDSLIRDEQAKRELLEVAKSFEALANGVIEVDQGKVTVMQDGQVLAAETLKLGHIIGLRQQNNVLQSETEESVQVLLADKMDVGSTVHVTTDQVQGLNSTNLLVGMQNVEHENTIVYTDHERTFIIENEQESISNAKDGQFTQTCADNTFIYSGSQPDNQNQVLNHVQSIEQSNSFNQSEAEHLLNQGQIEGQPQLIGHIQEVETMDTDHLYHDQPTQSYNTTGQSINIQTQQTDFDGMNSSNQAQHIDSQGELNQGFTQKVVYTNQPHHSGDKQQEIIFVLEEAVANSSSECHG
ncbi:uncharacterized protein [Antedon mediterranea]|uniref:uncharacterized protein isoform X2 n=1 Tax=Antedon mediterranea TaxID=105859 RepID=UPI003AF8E504